MVHTAAHTVGLKHGLAQVFVPAGSAARPATPSQQPLNSMQAFPWGQPSLVWQNEHSSPVVQLAFSPWRTYGSHNPPLSMHTVMASVLVAQKQ
jgi:hypothetical protein